MQIDEEAVEVSRGLKAGELPAAFAESTRLVDQDQPVARQYAEYAGKVLRRVLGEEYDPQVHRFLHLLSGARSEMGSIVPDAPRPPIVISAGMLRRLKDEDQFAGVLTHEFLHWKMAQREGHAGNSKGEEAGNDMWAVVKLQAAGYRPRAMAEVLNLFRPLEWTPQKYLDVHPDLQLRRRLTENAADVMLKVTGRENTGSTPFDPELKQLLSTLRQPSYMMDLLESRGFDKAQPPEQLGMIAQVFRSEPLEPGSQFRFGRVHDLAEAVSKVEVDLRVPAHRQAMDALADTLLEDAGKDQAAHSLHTSLANVWRQAPAPPGTATGPGKLGRLRDALDRFIIDPQTETQAVSDAVTIRELMPILANSRLAFDRTSTDFEEIDPRNIYEAGRRRKEHGLPAFPLDEPVELPWAQHLQWARHAVETNASPDIQVALALCGIRLVQRVPSISPEQPPVSFNGKPVAADYSSLPALSHRQAGRVDGFEHLTFDAQDRITGATGDARFAYWPGSSLGTSLGRATFETLRAGEENRQWQRVERAERNAAAADWTLLDRPQWVRSYDEAAAKTGFAEGSAELANHLLQQDWFAQGAVYFITALSRNHLVQAEHDEHARRVRQFIERHADDLTPDISIDDYTGGRGAVFEKTFVDKLSASRMTAPEGANSLLRQFVMIRPRYEDGFDLGLHKMSELLDKERSRALRQGVDLEWGVGDRQLGIAPDHPYILLACSPELGLLPEERIASVTAARYVDPDKSRPVFDRALFDPYERLGMTPPRTVQEVYDGQVETSGKLHGGNGSGLLSDTMLHRSLGLILEEPKQVLSTEEMITAHTIIKRTTDPWRKFKIASAEAARDAFDRAVDRSTKISVNGDTPVAALAEQYVQLTSFGVLKRTPRIRHSYEQALSSRIAALPHAAQREETAAALLYERGVTSGDLTASYAGTIQDPKLRSELIATLTDSLAERFGKDHGDPGYQASMTDGIADIAGRTSGATRFAILSQLAEKCEFQAPLAFHARDLLVDRELQALPRHNGRIAFGEIGLDVLNNSSSATRQVVQFLHQPFSYDAGQSLLSGLGSEYVSLIQDSLGPEAERDAAEMAHRNFWAMPFPARTLYLEKILFPVSSGISGLSRNGRGDALTFDDSRDLVLSLVAPPAEDHAAELSARRRRKPEVTATQVKRDLIDCYLNECGMGEQRLLLTAMLAANEPRELPFGESPNPMAGARSIISAAGGPAGDKLGQTVHSATDREDVRAEFAQSKKDASPTYRWQEHEMIAQSGLTERVGRVGRRLGGGAYGVTLEVAEGTGALTLLRSHVRERAEREFGVFERTATAMAGIHPAFSPYIDMVKQARAMSGIETDMDVAHRQHGAAKQLYEGVQTEADGRKSVFRVPAWVEHGRDYKWVGIVPGTQFNDLAAGPAEEKSYRRSSAKSLLAVELGKMLEGGVFDHDRYGGQQRLQGPVIGLFDHGAMRLDPPTDAQRRLLGKAIGRALRGHVLSGFKVPVADTLPRELDRASGKASGADRTYLIEAKRGLLALGDYMHELGPADTRKVFAQALTSPSVHPKIRSGMNWALGPLAPVVMMKMREAGRDSGVTIHAERAPPVTLTPSAAPSSAISDQGAPQIRMLNRLKVDPSAKAPPKAGPSSGTSNLVQPALVAAQASSPRAPAAGRF